MAASDLLGAEDVNERDGGYPDPKADGRTSAARQRLAERGSNAAAKVLLEMREFVVDGDDEDYRRSPARSSASQAVADDERPS